MAESQEKDQIGSEDSRRDFLKYAATISGVLALAGIASVMKAVVLPAVPATTTETSFPRIRLSSVSELATGVNVIFNYPLDNEPNILVKTGQKASGGVGPDGDIVAFSSICQHLGCTSVGYVPTGGSPSANKSFVASSPVAYCTCHGSVYDLVQGAKVVGGPSPRPLPQVTLEVDASGNVYATGMGPPSIFSHNTGSSDVNADLQGGNVVTST